LTTRRVGVGNKETIFIRQAIESAAGQAPEMFSVASTAMQCDYEGRSIGKSLGPVETHSAAKPLHLHILDG
jgi:hypothetical protein